MDPFLKGVLQGSIPVVVLVGGTHHIVKKLRETKPVLYWGSIIASAGLAFAIVQGKIPAPFMNAEEDDLYYCSKCDEGFSSINPTDEGQFCDYCLPSSATLHDEMERITMNAETFGSEYVQIGIMQSSPADGYNGYMKMMRDARRLVEIGNETGLDQKLGEAYQDESGRWFLPILQKGAETFEASGTKKPKLTPKQKQALDMMKYSYGANNNEYAYVEVDNRGWKPHRTRQVQALLDKGLIEIDKAENKNFYGYIENTAYIVKLTPLAWEYKYEDPFGKYTPGSMYQQDGDKMV